MEIYEAINNVEKRMVMVRDIHVRVYCLANMRVYANKVIEELRSKVKNVSN